MRMLHPAEDMKFISAVVPIDTTGAGQSGDWVSLKNYHSCAIWICQGAWAGGTSAVTLEQATDVAGTGAKALAFPLRWTGVALTDDNLAETAVTSDTFNLPNTANTTNLLFVRASQLDVDGGFDCIRVVCATPGANADLIAVSYVLLNPRFSQADPPTAIAD